MYGKCSQECQVNVGVPQGSILDPTLFLLCINDPPDDVICNIDTYADIVGTIPLIKGKGGRTFQKLSHLGEGGEGGFEMFC